jgi:hypothetical protein
LKDDIVKLNATIKIGEAKADFEFSPRGPGLYQANLKSITGRPSHPPPSTIILVRNVREWSGSCDDDNLINSLGRVIDQMARDAPIFSGKDQRRRPIGRSTSPDQ